MPVSYIVSPENDFSFGIDARSAENQIAPGFVKDLLNADIVEKRVRTRAGYQGYAGNLPIRVNELDYVDSTNQVILTLDTSINLESVRSTPLVVYGRSSEFTSGQGPFYNTADVLKYYDLFTVPLRKQFLAGTNTLSIAADEHGLPSTNMFVNVVESLSLSDRSYQQIQTTTIDIAESDRDVEIDYTTAANRNVFVYFADKSTGGGDNYVHPIVHDGTPTSQTFTINAATHVLNNFNIIVQLQVDNGADRSFAEAESVVIDSSGTVSITIENNSGGSVDYYAILSAAPVENVANGTVAGLATGTVTISALTSPWAFFGIYLEAVNGDREAVLPESMEYDDDTQELTITFVNSTAATRNFLVYYEYGELRSNQLCVTDASVTVDGNDARPQLTIWGLEHDELYTSKLDRESWVNHIDAYRRSGEQRLISGLGGNLFSARQYVEAGSTYGYPELFPNLNTRTDTARVLAPLFWNTGELPGRTRGYITADNSGTNWATVTAVEFDTGNDWTKYTISLPGKLILDSTGTPTTLSSVISVASGLEDWLTVEGMSYARHNGTFRIQQVQDGTDEIFVWVENDQSTSSDWDDAGCAGEAGVFTDQISWLTDSPYIASDRLYSASLSASDLISRVTSSDEDTTVVDGIVDIVDVAAGLLFVGRRSSNVVPLRSASPSATASTTNLVRGDMLSYTELSRLLRVKYVNPDSSRTVGITSDGETATVTLGSGDTSYLHVGMSVLLIQAGVYTGVQVITDIPSASTFEFETSEDDTVAGATLVGETAELDEEIEWQDTAGDVNAFRVEERWIPVEAPDDSFDLTPSTYVRQWDSGEYSEQAFLRSTMLADSMHLTNGSDEVFKFDGSNVYRSGLIPWQPGLFISQDTNGATIVTGLRSVSYSASNAAGGSLTVDPEVQQSIPVGSSVRLSGSTGTYVVTGFSDDGTNFYVLLNKSLDSTVSSSGSMKEIGIYRYYYRLNAVDVNGNLIASAVTGFQDHVVELTQNAAVVHKVVGLPAWDIYDYDRIEVEIYRTKLNTSAPFYKITTLPLSFDNTEGYVIFRDSFADTDLTELDVVNTALKGAELGTAWSDALRARHITSIGNRLVLGNLKDYPQLDLQIIGDANTSSSAFAGDTLLFRKDNADTGTTTNMVDRVKYEWINGTTGNATGFAIGSDQFSFTAVTLPGTVVAGDWIYLTYASVTSGSRTGTFDDTDVDTGTEEITVTAHGFTNGQQVRFSNSGGALPTGLSSSVTYYIINATTDTFQVSTTLGGSAQNISAAAGGGTHTVTLQLNDPTFAGWYMIDTVVSTTVTINLNGATAVTSYPDRYVLATDSTDVPVLLGTDGNLGMLNGDSFDIFDAMRRMAMAINSTMRMVDITQTGMDSFVPWLVARSGNDTPPAGRLIVRQPRADSDTFELLPTFSGYNLFVNDVRRTSGDQISASTKVFPSRILVSYENFAEIFDAPTTVLDGDSDSAIDINPADGQEVTGVIPFFGEAAFGAAQQSSILVVFKSNSIYLVDINQKVAGLNPVQRIETEGLGCTAPHSITVTKGGIMFANESGIYCLRRNQSIQYIGKFMERNWTERVSLDQLELAQGHHFGVGRSYKLSVPVADTEDNGYLENSEVYVYNHTAEEEGRMGAWSRYDNHPATGWANLAQDAYFGSTKGRVFSIRRLVGEEAQTNCRDDSSPILFRLDPRANDFGNAGIRKVFDRMVIHYRNAVRSVGTTVSFSLDTEREYSSTTAPVLPRTITTDGVSETVQRDIVSLSHNLDRRKGIFLQLRIENDTLDEPIEIAGIDYRVGGLTSSGIMTARDSRA